MTLQSTGSISLSEIQTEFGGTNPTSISEYYRGGTYVSNINVNNNIPTSGAISFSDFYLGKSSAVNVNYITSASLDTNVFTYTFNNISIGTASSDRLVVIGASINAEASQTYYISGITINGTSATTAATSASGKNCWIVYLPISTGITANVVVSLAGTGTPGRCAIGVYTITGQTSNTPVTVQNNLTGTPTASSSLTYYPGSVAIAAIFSYTNTPYTFTLSNLTENYDATIEDSRHAFGSTTFSANTLSSSATISLATGVTYMSIAAWR
jgi:hypothetical protein